MASSNNTIVFSPDTTILYFIDNGRSIPFQLEGTNGVLVTVLRGQLTVVSAPALPAQPRAASLQEPKAPLPGIIPDPGEELPAYPQDLSISLTDNRWSLFYHPEQETLGIIGATDIDFAIRERIKPKTDISLFLLPGHIVNIRKNGDRLRLTRVPL